jgi:peptide/nickel transport system ATP-binding protein
MNNKLVQIKNLKTHFYTEAGTVKAVDDISFDIYNGEVLGIVGESGSGKSVTSLSINRLIPNPPGKIVQMNEVLIKHHNLDEEEASERSIKMLDAVGIPNPKQRIVEYPHQFSGGMRQRVMIAMALQCNPSLLIADEPTTALDVTIQAQILDLMLNLKQTRDNSAILLITHDLAVVAETCDRVIVMYGGKIQEIAEINELFNNPVHPYTKALMQSIPKLNKKEKRLKALKGMVPSILDLGDGCKLCSRFEPKDCACGGDKIEPDLIKISDDHYVRCNPKIL